MYRFKIYFIFEIFSWITGLNKISAQRFYFCFLETTISHFKRFFVFFIFVLSDLLTPYFVFVLYFSTSPLSPLWYCTLQATYFISFLGSYFYNLIFQFKTTAVSQLSFYCYFCYSHIFQIMFGGILNILISCQMLFRNSGLQAFLLWSTCWAVFPSPEMLILLLPTY